MNWTEEFRELKSALDLQCKEIPRCSVKFATKDLITEHRVQLLER